MRANITGIVACFLMSFSALCSSAQSIDLGIQNIPQQAPMWCWAAASQQIIYWLTGNPVAQCDLVAAANAAPGVLCCSNPSVCNVPGNLYQIQNLILAYGGHYSAIAQPTDPQTLYQALNSGKAIVIYLQTSPTIGHFVVLRGMYWVNTNMGVQPVFMINDPMAVYTAPVSFPQLISIWRAAIVVQ